MTHTPASRPRVRPYLEHIAAWLEANVGASFASPASAADLAALAAALGGDLDEELVAVLAFERPLAILEYALIPPARWAEELARAAGDGDGEQAPCFAERRWLPLAEDGGGNLWIVDTSASPAIVRRWERAGRVASYDGRAIPAFFAHLALALESGQLVHDADSGTYDGPFFDLLADPVITSETVIVYRAAELVQTDLGIDAAERLPDDAGPYGCLYYVAAPAVSARMFAAIPEGSIDHVEEGMLVAADVISRLQHRCDLSAFGGRAGVGFHASPADEVERWLRAQPDLAVVSLVTLLSAQGGAPSWAGRPGAIPVLERDLDIGEHHFDSLVRGDAVMGLLADVPAFTRQMMEVLWRAADAGEARAFATLGECYYAVLVPRGAFDGVAPELDEARAFSEVALGIEDPELPPLTFALRCWYEAAVRGDRIALLRFARTSRTGPARARELARELLAELGDPTPEENHALGQVHGSLGDHRASVAVLMAAAEAGDLDAAFDLHVCYAQGLGVEIDAEASRAWLDRAAAGDHPRALYNVAAAHATGTGRDKDPDKAARLYQTAAELGNPMAAVSLACMILAGECEGSVHDACGWLDLAGTYGFDPAPVLAAAGFDDPRLA